MAERGMTAEAGTLARACLETVFYQGAAAKDQGFMEELRADAANHKEQMVTSLRSLSPEQQGFSEDQLEQLQESVSDAEGARRIKMCEAAKRPASS